MSQLQRLKRGESYLDWRWASGGTLEIVDLHVHADSRRCGIGREMVTTVLDSKEVSPGVLVWAITRADNIVAQHFYEAMRFRVVGVLRAFYKRDLTKRDSVDAVMYGRNKGDQS